MTRTQAKSGRITRTPGHTYRCVSGLSGLFEFALSVKVRICPACPGSLSGLFASLAPWTYPLQHPQARIEKR
jgi:hypothetical protein